jgi:arylformamidase
MEVGRPRPDKDRRIRARLSPTPLHQAMQLSYWQHQYSPRATVAHPQRYFDSWRDRAALTRQRLAGRLDIAYGSDKREKLDFFSRRAAPASGTLVFIHGGYWRAFGKEDFSWVADEFIPRGVSVAVLSYPLMPDADFPTMHRSISDAFEYLTVQLLDEAERAKLVVVGHSAGAHLAAQCVASSVPPQAAQYVASSGTQAAQYDAYPNPQALRFPPVAFVGVSGLYDLLPVHYAGIFADSGASPGDLHDASPLYLPPPERTAVLVAVGADESREFQRQSERLADAWESRVCGFLRVPQRNHFSVIDDLADEHSELFRQVLSLFNESR